MQKRDSAAARLVQARKRNTRPCTRRCCSFGLLGFACHLILRFSLAPTLGPSVPLMIFIPGVVLSSWYGGFCGGILATWLTLGSELYLRHLLGYSEPFVVSSIVFACTGTFISWVNTAFHSAEYRANEELRAKEEYQAALRATEERLTLALHAGQGAGTWDWNIPERCVYSSPQLAQLFGIAPTRASEGVPVEEFTARIHPQDQKRQRADLKRALKTGLVYDVEYRILQDDGQFRWICARGRCHRNAQRKAVRFLGVAFDITKLKVAEAELRRANRYLEEFAYVASHDLQEPLRMVNIYTQLMLRKIEGDPAFQEYAGFVQQGVSRMHTLISDLLEFSRAARSHEDKPIGTANLEESFRNALSLLNNQITATGALIRSQPLPRVYGDEKQLSHVFQNILSNALKYRSSDRRPELEISSQLQGSRWVVAVKDNGIGFDPQYASSIFGLFKRLHQTEYPGTGVGLAICERIVERCGGRIWAEGIAGEGSTFYFSLSTPKRQFPEVGAPG